MRESKRIGWIDMAKGYGMICVIIGHLQELPGLIAYVYTFHMPLFFFLSGYVLKTNMSFYEFLKRKIKGILIPYFGLGIPALLFFIAGHIYKNDLIIADSLKVFFSFLIQRRWGTIWFLACLFWLNIFFYLLVNFILDERILGIVVIILTLAGLIYYRLGGRPLVWNIDVCFTALPFFYMGYTLKNIKKLREILFYSKYKNLILGFCIILNPVAGFLSWLIAGEGLEMANCLYGVEVLVYASAFSGIVYMLALSRKFTLRIIQYIGENSLIYLAWHQTIMIPFIKELCEKCNIFQWENPTVIQSVIKIIIYLVLIIVPLTIANLIIRKTPLRVIIGK